MKFSINRKSISDVLSLIQGVTSRTTTLAITSVVLIKSEGSQIIVTANDLETVFQGQYDADVESDGIISINAKKLYEIVKEYPDNLFPINEIENRWVEIGEGNIQYHIVSSDYDNFPEYPVIEDISFVETDSAMLKKIVDVAASISYSKEEKRPYVLGALLEYINNENGDASISGTDQTNNDNTAFLLRMVSTDSKRLYSFDISLNGVFDIPEDGVIVPKKGLSELGKFLNVSGKVNIGVKDNHFIVKRENEIMMIKLLEGEYPDYKRVLSTEGFTPIHINRSIFMMMMKRMSILVSDDFKSVIFNFRENELVVTITNPDIGESKEEISIGYTGDHVESAFNPKYFIDALNAIKSEDVLVHIKDSRNPCILKGHDDVSFICAIMAMSV